MPGLIVKIKARRARRRELLRRRAVLLWMKAELDDMAAHGLLADRRHEN